MRFGGSCPLWGIPCWSSMVQPHTEAVLEELQSVGRMATHGRDLTQD